MPPDQSLVGCLISWLFLLGGVVALAVVLYRDEIRAWISDLMEEIR